MSEMGPQTQMKKALFFDLYGTLIDINTDENRLWVYETLSRYLAYHSVKISPEELKKRYFSEIQQHFAESTEIYPEVDVFKIFQTIIQRYGNKSYSKKFVIDTTMLFRSLTINRFAVFTDLYYVLTSLYNNYKTAIISDAQWVFAEPEIAMLSLDRFFKLRIFSSQFGFKKPDIRLFNMAMQRLRVKPQEAIYIGDNPQKDLIGAKKAGMKCILFRSEYKSYNGFQPDRCFADYSELETIIHEIL